MKLNLHRAVEKLYTITFYFAFTSSSVVLPSTGVIAKVDTVAADHYWYFQGTDVLNKIPQ